MSGRGRPAGLLGYVLVAGAGTSWGSQSAVAKLLLTSGLPAAELVSVRTALAAAILVGAIAVARPRLLRVSPRDLGSLALLGVVGMALSNYSFYLALTRIPVAMAALLIYTAPLMVLAATVLVYREPLRRPDVVAALVTLAGAALVVRAYEPQALRGNAVGVAAATVTALAFAVYNLLGKRVAARVSPWTMLAYSMAASAAFWVPVAPPWRFLLAPHPPAVWAGLGVVSVFGTLLPFALYLAGLARISPAHASVTSTVEPVVAATVAFLVLGERLAWPQLGGGALVLLGIGLLHRRPHA